MLHQEIVDGMDSAGSVEAPVDRVAPDIGAGGVTVDVEMNGISTKIESLSNMCEFDILNLCVFNFMKEKMSSELIRTNFMSESVLETSLSSKSCSNAEFTFW